jgi:hypothetical protein
LGIGSVGALAFSGQDACYVARRRYPHIALAGAADDADVAPSNDALVGYAALMAMLDKSLAEWQALKDEDLAALSARLHVAGKPELTVTPAAK